MAWGEARLEWLFSGGYSARVITAALIDGPEVRLFYIAERDEVGAPVAVASHDHGFLAV